ncbi:MAG: tol-pal system-associated acyl-CoA thioesterase [Rhodospirillales bacterium]
MARAATARNGGGAPGCPAHVYPLRVYYEDTDAGGVVYHANYLRFAERARTEMLRQAGVAQAALWNEQGLAFTVRRCEAEFLRPARLDDALEVHTRVLEARGARVAAEQVVKRAGDEIARLKLEIACVDRRGRPARLPPKVGDALTAREIR